MFKTRQRIKELEREVDLLRGQMAVQLFSSEVSKIYSRKDFGYVLNYLGLVGLGVEVGVRKANYSEHLLKTWKGMKLYSIDPWEYFPDSGYIDGSNVKQKEQDRIFKEATKKLTEFGKRSEVIRKTSLESVSQFTDVSLDFVYLDAQHHYEAVKEDIAAWYPKVVQGGVISGDDYVDIEEPDNKFGVKKAVDEFVSENGLELILTIDGLFPSWFVQKKDDSSKSE
ncbi:MAG: hypothetical protein EP297_06510 [Gammaproteobacteria bacterium]|nr:MAG: hypothetical protein EP297_06510 [Gammaproteobacteria bacterium]